MNRRGFQGLGIDGHDPGDNDDDGGGNGEDDGRDDDHEPDQQDMNETMSSVPDSFGRERRR